MIYSLVPHQRICNKQRLLSIREQEPLFVGEAEVCLLLRLLPLEIHIENNPELVLNHPVQGAPICLMKRYNDLSAVF